MRSFLTAIQFLTIIPVKGAEPSEANFPKSMIYYPLTGFVIGLAAYCVYAAGSKLIGPIAGSALSVVAMALLTGGLHLDGLSDTSDAFFSGRSRQEMLDIMRDPRAGSMGVLAIVSSMIVKFAVIASLGAGNAFCAILLMCVLGRWSMVLSMRLFTYCRPVGKAGALANGITQKIFTLSCVTCAVIAYLIWGSGGILLQGAVAGITYIFGAYSARLLGGITGDVLGATNELAEISVLLVVASVGA